MCSELTPITEESKQNLLNPWPPGATRNRSPNHIINQSHQLYEGLLFPCASTLPPKKGARDGGCVLCVHIVWKLEW